MIKLWLQFRVDTGHRQLTPNLALPAARAMLYPRDMSSVGRRYLLAASAAASMLVLCLGSASGATRTYSSGALRVAVADQGTIDRVIAIPDAGAVSYLAVSLRLDHARVSDLVISLVAPDGASVPLSVRRGGSGRNFGSGSRTCSGQVAVFEDGASLRLADDEPPFEGLYRPDGRLARLYGKEARGRWTLRIADDRAGQTGTLFCWKLDLSRDVVERRRASSGAVRAELLYRERNFRYRDVRLKVVRAGKTEYDRPLTRIGCGGCAYWRPLLDGRAPIIVRDLDRDGEPEVVLDLFTGGAHCCTYSLILRHAPRVGTYKAATFQWGNVGYRLVDFGRDGRPELASGDDRFNYAFAAYAASATPIRVWHYERGSLVNVTRRFPGPVAAHAAALWNLYLRARRSAFPEARGILAAYLADEYLLGRQKRGWERMEAARRRGDLGRGPSKDGYPAGAAYLARLRSFLRTTGYAR